MPSPLVSVIIPTFNRADLLPATLASVVGQTYADMEILVVDDGSTDGTEAVVTAHPDPRIRYIKNVWAGSPAITRNTGIREATGSLLAFVDSDDLWLPNKLAEQLAHMAEHPDCGWCFTHCHTLEHVSGKIIPTPLPALLAAQEFGPEDLLCNNFVPSPTPLIKRSLLDQAGGFCEDTAIRFVEDWELWLRLFAISRPGFLAEPLALYRRHPENATGAADGFTRFMRCLAAIQRAVELNPGVYAELYTTAVRTHLGFVTDAFVRGNVGQVRAARAAATLLPLRAPELTAMYYLSFLPNFLGRHLVNLYRSCRLTA